MISCLSIDEPNFRWEKYCNPNQIFLFLVHQICFSISVHHAPPAPVQSNGNVVATNPPMSHAPPAQVSVAPSSNGMPNLKGTVQVQAAMQPPAFDPLTGKLLAMVSSASLPSEWQALLNIQVSDSFGLCVTSV